MKVKIPASIDTTDLIAHLSNSECFELWAALRARFTECFDGVLTDEEIASLQSGQSHSVVVDVARRRYAHMDNESALSYARDVVGAKFAELYWKV